MLRELEESGNWAAVRFVLETRAQALEQTENPSTASYLQGLHSRLSHSGSPRARLGVRQSRSAGSPLEYRAGQSVLRLRP